MKLLIGLALAFLLLALFRQHRKRVCRWQKIRSDGPEKLHGFKCLTCGATTMTTSGKRPVTCHADTSPPEA